MAKHVDLSDFSEDELTHLIDEATNLRTTKFEGYDREKSLEKQEKTLAEKIEQDQTFRAAGGD